MNRIPTHKLTICTFCRHKGTTCRAGYDLIEKLRSAIVAAGDVIGDEFEISGTACVAGCDRPCTVAYYGTPKASYLFGDIDPDENIAELVNFAQQYAALHDGWHHSTDHPALLCDTNLARIPAAIMAVERTMERLS